MASVWDDEGKIDLLKKLWRDGESASAISARLGISRNAVLSKIHRIGAADRPKSVSKANRDAATRRARAKRGPPRSPRQPAASSGKAAALHGLFGPVESVAERIDDLPPVPLDKRKGVADLEMNDCRWPIGDPREAGFHFCARTKLEWLPYCQHHARVAYRPLDSPPRRGAGRKTDPNGGAGSREMEMPASGQRRETEEVS